MRLRLRLPCLLLGLIVFAGCPEGCDGPLISGLVTITYRPLFNFSKWEVRFSDGGIQSRGEIDDGVYMRYRIVSISNTDSKPTIFHFNPGKIHASDPSERQAFPVIGLGGTLAFDVLPGTSSTNRLNVTIKAKGDLADIKNQIQFLQYESGAGEHVLMVNEVPKATFVPYLNPLRIPGDSVN